VRALYDQWLGEHGFRISGHRVDADAANPRICVELSDPLPRDRAGLADFLQIETGRGLTVEVDPQALCVDGVVHGERYRLRVRAGLPAADGETLASSADLDIYVRDRSPSVRFQGRAYVLPKGGEAAIPLVSINTRLVKAQVLRLGDRSLASAAWEGGPLLKVAEPLRGRGHPRSSGRGHLVRRGRGGDGAQSGNDDGRAGGRPDSGTQAWRLRPDRPSRRGGGPGRGAGDPVVRRLRPRALGPHR
jgi:hypothetical protein